MGKWERGKVSVTFPEYEVTFTYSGGAYVTVGITETARVFNWFVPWDFTGPAIPRTEDELRVKCEQWLSTHLVDCRCRY